MKRVTWALALVLTVSLAAAAQADVIINEILYDPAAGLAGDANGDGTRDAAEDEFVEIFNNGASAVDISGWTLSDDDGDDFVFGAGTSIAAGEYIVLFGGGTPTGIPGQVFTDNGSIGTGLANGGDLVRLIDNLANVIDSVDYSTLAGLGSDVSLAWDGTQFVDQDTLIPGTLFTPGAANAVAAVPEPGSAVLLVMGVAGLVVTRRRRS